VFERDPLGFLHDAHREFGDVVRLRFWPELYHLVSDPDEIRRVLTAEPNRYQYEMPAPETPPGGVSPNIEAETAPRFHRLAQEVFHTGEGMAALTGRMTDAIADRLATWDERAGSTEPFDVAAEMLRLTLMVLGPTLLDVDLRSDVDALVPAFNINARESSLQQNISVFQLLERGEAPRDPNSVAGGQLVGDFVSGLVEDRRRLGPGGTDLLTRLAFDHATDDPDRLVSDEQVHAAVEVLLLAGHSGASSALAWTFHLVGLHPDVRRRLEAEVDAVLGDRLPLAEDLARLKFTKMVVLESMRLYPPVWMLLPLRALRQDHVGGFVIPAGSKIVVSPWVLHRNPDRWASPERFDPERFARREPGAYLPFGAGPRGCIAAQFGLVEARLALAMAVQRYRWEPATDVPVVPDPQLALWPRDGLPVVLERRA